MFTDNWFMFLLIIMLVFSSDGSISNTESTVFIFMLFALVVSCGCQGENSDDNCFCNRNS